MPTIDELVSAANAIKADAAKKAADENSVLRDVLTEVGTSGVLQWLYSLQNSGQMVHRLPLY